MNIESIQLINTAILKSKEANLNQEFETELKKHSESPALAALEKAIDHLSESESISRDQAALQLVKFVRDLDKVWTDYVFLEGIDRLKNYLKNQPIQ